MFADATVVVRRGEVKAEDASELPKGIEGLAAAMREVRLALAGAAVYGADVRSKDGTESVSGIATAVKMFRVELRDRQAETSVYFQASAKTAAGRVQINGTWNCQWELRAAGKPPKLRSIRVED